MKHSKVSLSSEMGHAIVDQLSSRFSLPENGLLFGKTVCDAVLSLVDGSPFPTVGVVDVLVESQGPAAPLHRRGRELYRVDLRTLTRNQNVGLATLILYEGPRVGPIVTWQKSGDINLPEHIVDTLDINAVQVAVDLLTRRLYWSPNYAKFVRTRQLDIVCLSTPVESLVRYLRKRRTMAGVYGNDERQLQMVGAACLLHYSRYLAVTPSQKSCLLLPVEKHKQTADYSDRMSPFAFTLPDEKDGRRGTAVHELLWNHFRIVDHVDGARNNYFVIPTFPVEPALLTLPPWQITLLPFVSKVCHEKHAPAKQAILAYLLEHMGGVAFLGYTAFGDAFLDCRSPVPLAQIDKITRRYRLGHQLHQATATAQLDYLGQVRDLARIYGQWVYGVLEHHPTLWLDGKNLRDFFVGEGSRLASIVFETTFPPATIRGFQISQIANGLEMVIEGVQMRHCLGTVVIPHIAREGDTQTRYLRVRGPRRGTDWLTVEVVLYSVWPPEFQAAHGMVNREATNREMAIVADYLLMVQLSSWIGLAAAKWVAKLVPKALQIVELPSRLQWFLEMHRRWLKHLLRFRIGIASADTARRLGLINGTIRTRGARVLDAGAEPIAFWIEVALQLIGRRCTGLHQAPYDPEWQEDDSIPF